jgi:hypothetical protein
MQPPTSPLLHQKCHNQVAPVVLSSHLREENEKRKRKKRVPHKTNETNGCKGNKVFFSAPNKPPTPYNTHWSALCLFYSHFIISYIIFVSFTICATRLHYPPSLPHQRMHFSYTDTIHTNINFLKKKINRRPFPRIKLQQCVIFFFKTRVH